MNPLENLNMPAMKLLDQTSYLDNMTDDIAGAGENPSQIPRREEMEMSFEERSKMAQEALKQSQPTFARQTWSAEPPEEEEEFFADDQHKQQGQENSNLLSLEQVEEEDRKIMNDLASYEDNNRRSPGRMSGQPIEVYIGRKTRGRGASNSFRGGRGSSKFYRPKSQGEEEKTKLGMSIDEMLSMATEVCEEARINFDADFKDDLISKFHQFPIFPPFVHGYILGISRERSSSFIRKHESVQEKAEKNLLYLDNMLRKMEEQRKLQEEMTKELRTLYLQQGKTAISTKDESQVKIDSVIVNQSKYTPSQIETRQVGEPSAISYKAPVVQTKQDIPKSADPGQDIALGLAALSHLAMDPRILQSERVHIILPNVVSRTLAEKILTMPVDKMGEMKKLMEKAITAELLKLNKITNG